LQLGGGRLAGDGGAQQEGEFVVEVASKTAAVGEVEVRTKAMSSLHTRELPDPD
jgi:hypothetical protein